MRRLRLISVVAILATVAAAPPAAAGADDSKADRNALRTAQKQLHSQVTLQRVQAAERLRGLPALKGAKAIVPSVLNDPEIEVRRAAYDTLLHWKENPEVCLFLLKVLEREARGKKSEAPVVVALVVVLLASDLPETQRDLGKFLDDYGVKNQDGAAALIQVADELGQQGDEQALASLRRLTRLKCFTGSFACRRAVIQAITLVRRPQAIEALIALLPDVDGEVRGDIVRYLSEVSGQQHGKNREAWQAWWKSHQEQFEFPPPTARKSAAVAQPGQPSYYGLAIQARRMVFVIDISGSMNGPRLSAAKRELIQAIDSLPKDAEFGIAAFNSRVAVWRRELTPATPAAKQAAAVYVCALRAGGMTAACDALEAAFRLDAEAIYFLSDGEPTAGRIVAPQAIVAAVTEANRRRRISLYTIGIAPGLAGSPLDLFMKALAEENFGSYRRVEQ